MQYLYNCSFSTSIYHITTWTPRYYYFYFFLIYEGVFSVVCMYVSIRQMSFSNKLWNWRPFCGFLRRNSLLENNVVYFSAKQILFLRVYFIIELFPTVLNDQGDVQRFRPIGSTYCRKLGDEHVEQKKKKINKYSRL